MLLQPGDLFADRYRVIELLGAGGFGAVYRVENEKLRELAGAEDARDWQLALKVMLPEWAGHRDLVQRFVREMSLASRLSHSNGVPIRDAGVHDGQLYYTMELVDGRAMDRVIREEGAIAPMRLAEWGRQTLDFLAYLHANGHIHRDLKPANLMLQGEEERVRVLDLGIARKIDQDASSAFLTAGGVIGTPQYMAPEYIAGGEADERIDVYAMGVVLYECAVGHVPFVGATPQQVWNRVVTQTPPPISALRAGFPEALERVILRAMSKEPAARQASAATFKRELEEAVPQETETRLLPPHRRATVPFDSPRSGPGAPRPAARSRRRAVVLTAVALLLAAAYPVYGWLKPGESGDAAVLTLAEPTLDAEIGRAGLRIEGGVPPFVVLVDGEQTGPPGPERVRQVELPPRGPEERTVVVAVTDGQGARVQQSLGLPAAEAAADPEPESPGGGGPEDTPPPAPGPGLEPLGARIVAPERGARVGARTAVQLELQGEPPFRVRVGDGEEVRVTEAGVWRGEASFARSGSCDLTVRVVDGAERALTETVAVTCDLDAPEPEEPLRERFSWRPDEEVEIRIVADEPLGEGSRADGRPARIDGAELRATVTRGDDDRRGIPVRLVDTVGNARDLEVSLRRARIPAGLQPIEGRTAADRWGLGWATPVVEPRTGIVAVLIPPTAVVEWEFFVGAVPGDAAAAEAERPRRRVELTEPIYVGETEVSVAQWETARSELGASVPSVYQPRWAEDLGQAWRQQPAGTMSRAEAEAFCAAIGARLPTEAEWEWCARLSAGGPDTLFPWGDAFEDGGSFANVRDRAAAGEGEERASFTDGFPHSAGVGRMAALPETGLRHLVGNVIEWCEDAFSDVPCGPGGGGPASDPVWRSGSAEAWVGRGGSFKEGPSDCRISRRYRLSGTYDDVGLRVVFDAAPR